MSSSPSSPPSPLPTSPAPLLSRLEQTLETISRRLGEMHRQQIEQGEALVEMRLEQMKQYGAQVAQLSDQTRNEAKIIALLEQMNASLHRLAGGEDSELNSNLQQIIALLDGAPPPPPQPASFTAALTID